MTWWHNLLRRARLRGLREGQVQVARAESLDHDAKDDAERWQDYGFAAHPVDGQGLVINAGGHTIVLRMDRLADRPQLEAYEVSVWHKEGHRVTLRAGQVVDVECAVLNIAASTSVTIDTPSLTVTQPHLMVGGKQLAGHAHGSVQTGGGVSGPNL